MKFIIDRSKWRCGGCMKEESARGEGETCLLNQQGFMCCLGQISEQLGVPQSRLLELALPNGVVAMASSVEREDMFNRLALLVRRCNKPDEHVDYEPNHLSNRAMGINDSTWRTDAEREQDLINAFAEAGHVIEFVGEYVLPEKEIEEVDN